MIFVEHPLGGERGEGVTRRARQATDQLTALLSVSDQGKIGRAEPASVSLRPPSVEADLTVPDTVTAVLAAFCEREWCDGLPIVPPTEERVRAMLGGAPADRSLGPMPPLWRHATLEKLAVSAVMAGCGSGSFPVVVAAVETMPEPGLTLHGVQATTHP